MEVWSDAYYVWETQRDEVCIGYATEEREYEEAYPKPTLKETMIGLKGAGICS